MEFFTTTSFRLLDAKRPKPRDFFINAYEDSCTTDILDSLLERMDEETDDESLHDTMVVVVRRLLELCEASRGTCRKSDVCTMIFQFIVYYPGAFDWTCDNPRFLDQIINKLKEFAPEREEGRVVKGGRPFLEDETRDMAILLTQRGELEKAAILEGLIN